MGNSRNGLVLTGSTVAVKASNGSTLDDWRNNTEGTLLASAARTATTDSPIQTNYNGRGVTVYINLTAVPGTADTIQVRIMAKDGSTAGYSSILDGTALNGTTAIGLYKLQLYPGANDGNAKYNGINGVALPRQWYVQVKHVGTGSFTYSVSHSMEV